jgi:hypothetical protein
MKQLLKQYLVLGIAVQFVLAGFLDFGGFLSAAYYRGLPELPEPAGFVISIRHWAFVWPVVVLFFVPVLFHRTRTDETLLHLFGGMMLVTVAVMVIASWCFVQPLFSMDFGMELQHD